MAVEQAARRRHFLLAGELQRLDSRDRYDGLPGGHGRSSILLVLQADQMEGAGAARGDRLCREEL